jgi:hypothetical protein
MIVLSEEIVKMFICRKKLNLKYLSKKNYWSDYEPNSPAIKKKVEAQA